jgi:hypothetical protein
MGRQQKLTSEQQHFVVQQLARFGTPSEVVGAVNRLFGIEITRQAVHRYSPEHNPAAAERWRETFDAERERFAKELESIAVTHRAFRLQELEELCRLAKVRGNHVLAAALLEQAAKEMGGRYTNRRENVDAQLPPVATWTDEQLQRVGDGEDPQKLLGAGGAARC